MTEEPTDEGIEGILRAASEDQWRALWEATDVIAAEPSSGEWAGGEQEESIVYEGVERPVSQMPYVRYSDGVLGLIKALEDLGAIVPFNWGEWSGKDRYREVGALDNAPVADAVRMLTLVVRADRFSEGFILAKFEDGTLPAALRRLRLWYDIELADA